jgi:hypothetical protein
MGVRGYPGHAGLPSDRDYFLPYEAGWNATVDDKWGSKMKNPHLQGSPEHIEWNRGRVDCLLEYIMTGMENSRPLTFDAQGGL